MINEIVDSYLEEAASTVPFEEGDIVTWKGKDYTVLEVFKAMKKVILCDKTYSAPFSEVTMKKKY